MKSIRLTENFKLDEFTKSAGITIDPTEQQIYCLQILCWNILQPIRNKFGPVKITSGLRNEKSYIRLLEQGYPASKTSDHFAWSSVNPKGTGAADIFCRNATSMFDVFHWVINNIKKYCRQIIYYPDMNVLHVSNNFNNIFKMPDTINKDRRVLIKTDDGFVPYKNF